jgi:hypothetical protein
MTGSETGYQPRVVSLVRHEQIPGELSTTCGAGASGAAGRQEPREYLTIWAEVNFLNDLHILSIGNE